DLGAGDDQEMFFSPGNNFFYITRQQFAPHDVYLGEGDDAYVEFPAKATGNDCYTAFPGKYDWYETAKLNYGVDPWNGSKHFEPVPSTWQKMLDILLYWAEKGVDGFRCDMAHMVPLEFWNWAIGNVKARYPKIIFIAEMYDIGLYRPFIHYGGFDYLYDKVNLYDTLHGIETSDVSAANLTSCWQTVEGISGNMLNFLENHDEVRYASPAFAGKAENVTAPLVVSSMMNTGPMMIYSGQELGEDAAGATGYSGDDGRTSIFDYCVIPTLRQWLNKGACDGSLTAAQQRLRDTYTRVLTLCNQEKAISDGAFFDLMYVNYNNPHFNPHRHYAFLRYHAGTVLVIAVNFGNQDQTLHIYIPELAFDMAALPKGLHKCTELLSGQTETKEIDPAHAWVTEVKAHGAVIWKVD
ncbi:MAG: alpha-amylase, partial [Muribaculaceae bacterium]|nr:alpha-amylase [Muribaculaceae bacterium]